MTFTVLFITFLNVPLYIVFKQSVIYCCLNVPLYIVAFSNETQEKVINIFEYKQILWL